MRPSALFLAAFVSAAGPAWGVCPPPPAGNSCCPYGYAAAGLSLSNTASSIRATGFENPNTTDVSAIEVYSAVVATEIIQCGIYANDSFCGYSCDYPGTLVCETVTMPGPGAGGGWTTLPMTGGCCTLAPGTYFLAFITSEPSNIANWRWDSAPGGACTRASPNASYIYNAVVVPPPMPGVFPQCATVSGADPNLVYSIHAVCGCTTPTDTETSTVTRTPTETPTVTETATRTASRTRTLTATKTESGTATESRTATESGTPTATATPTATSTVSPTRTESGTPTESFTRTGTRSTTATATATATPSPTRTASSTTTSTATRTPTATATATPTASNTKSESATDTDTRTPSPTPSATATPTFPPSYFRVDRNAASAGEAVTVTFLPKEAGRAKIVVFNSAGELVRLLADRDVSPPGLTVLAWDLTNERGEPVGSGVYVLRAIVPGMNLKPFRLGVTR